MCSSTIKSTREIVKKKIPGFVKKKHIPTLKIITQLHVVYIEYSNFWLKKKHAQKGYSE